MDLLLTEAEAVLLRQKNQAVAEAATDCSIWKLNLMLVSGYCTGALIITAVSLVCRSAPSAVGSPVGLAIALPFVVWAGVRYALSRRRLRDARESLSDLLAPILSAQAWRTNTVPI